MNLILAIEELDNFLIIKSNGIVENGEDEKELSSKYYEEILTRDFKKVLIDQRNIDFRSSILDQTDAVDHYDEEFEAKVRLIKIAILVSEKDRKLNEFWELYANNRGYPWKVFTDNNIALEYLKVTN